MGIKLGNTFKTARKFSELPWGEVFVAASSPEGLVFMKTEDLKAVTLGHQTDRHRFDIGCYDFGFSPFTEVIPVKVTLSFDN